MSGLGIPIVSDVADFAGDLLFGQDEPITSVQPVEQVTPMPVAPEANNVEKRKHAAFLKAKRRGRASTVLTMDNEPLGGL